MDIGVIHFLKNVMMAGGLLQIAAFGAGALSIDNRAKNTAPNATSAVSTEAIALQWIPPPMV